MMCIFFPFQSTAELKRADLLKVLEVADIIKEREEFARERELLELQRTRLALVREGGTLPTPSGPPTAATTAPSTAPSITLPTAPSRSATQDEKIEEMHKNMIEMQNKQSQMETKLDKILSGKIDSCYSYIFPFTLHIGALQIYVK